MSDTHQTPEPLDPQRMKTIFYILNEAIPDAKIELEYDDPYSLLVSVVLSARSTDVQVNKATKELFLFANTPEKMLELGYDTLCSYINTVGLYKTKAKNIIRLSEILVNQYNGTVPRTKLELMSLPGVGLKSANVLLNVLYKKPTVAVDTHVFRVARRLDFSKASTPEKMSVELEQKFQQLEPDLALISHHLLVLHGRYTCKARKPKCSQCPIRDYCRSSEKNIPDQ